MLDNNFGTSTPSQMAEETSCATPVLYWISSQSVLCNHMHILPYSCTTSQTPLYGPWLFLANPALVLQLKYLAILMHKPPAPALIVVSHAESSVFETYMLPVVPAVKECSK